METGIEEFVDRIRRRPEGFGNPAPGRRGNPGGRDPSAGGQPGPAPAAIERLRKRLERGAGLRGVYLAELALRAGITPPRARFQAGAEAALWTELARENAALRREADRLMARKESITRRIRRARARLQGLRVRLMQQRLGLPEGSLRDFPLPRTWQELGIWWRPPAAKAAKAGDRALDGAGATRKASGGAAAAEKKPGKRPA